MSLPGIAAIIHRGLFCPLQNALLALHVERNHHVDLVHVSMGSGLETSCACQDVVVCQPSLDFPTIESNGLSSNGAKAAARYTWRRAA